MKSRALSRGFSAILLLLCACTSPDIPITARVSTAASAVGDGVTVAMAVIDDRDKTVVGDRRYGNEHIKYEMTATNIIPALEAEIAAGLETKGFTVVSPGDSADAELEANLRGFKFNFETNILTNAYNMSVVLRAEAKKRGKKFRRTYRLSEEERLVFKPRVSRIKESMNDSLAAVLNKMMADDELMRFLAD